MSPRPVSQAGSTTSWVPHKLRLASSRAVASALAGRGWAELLEVLGADAPAPAKSRPERRRGSGGGAAAGSPPRGPKTPTVRELGGEGAFSKKKPCVARWRMVGAGI